ncbi:DUF2158 domain-containing protein [Rhizobium leguminosarum]|uniref:YodC family protein n=1 Tax=Rhizobium leguminosarum TaxID=384 RepID=UPI00102FF0EC|nr:DUF2158 domain-containing protein [Rhizobium leguminosarum]TAY66535.1 DUF2158 domain-containing protein [Rhizobium leguminosarum]TBF35461.1 DUF2158 domain-containing protein [Rhizobium leguminosarum]
MPSFYQDAIKVIGLPLPLDVSRSHSEGIGGFMSFSPGDIVQMKSGGPPMTVERQEGDSFICSWMEQSGPKNSQKHSKKTDTFLAVSLVAFQRAAIGFSQVRRR